ncbi:MAG: ribose-phosphate pyrophosphokinase-like domain-containing protein, partial [Pseudomonadales bacterium]|nr:ribose-phosphate pyrophosphokinase-like domain-containing protein [Pseudomonadales bacterium]
MTSQPREFTPRAPIALITCEAGRSFAQSVADSMNVPLAPSVESWFACGEGKMEILANVRGHDVYIFQSTVGNQDERSVYDRF